MFTSNINITLPTTEQILWAYQACASPSFTSFTVEEKTAVMDMFLNVLQVLQARFANDAATISTEAASRRERILAKIEEAKLEYATLKSMLAMGFKEDFSQSGVRFPPPTPASICMELSQLPLRQPPQKRKTKWLKGNGYDVHGSLLTLITMSLRSSRNAVRLKSRKAQGINLGFDVLSEPLCVERTSLWITLCYYQ